MVIESPCKLCQDRIFGCHSNCERYIEYKQKRKDWDDTVRKGKAEHANYMSYLHSARQKMKTSKKGAKRK